MQWAFYRVKKKPLKNRILQYGLYLKNFTSCPRTLFADLFNGELCSMHIQLKREAEIMIPFNCSYRYTYAECIIFMYKHEYEVQPAFC